MYSRKGVRPMVCVIGLESSFQRRVPFLNRPITLRRSVVILEGVPKRAIQVWKKAPATVLAVISGMGTASTHLIISPFLNESFYEEKKNNFSLGKDVWGIQSNPPKKKDLVTDSKKRGGTRIVWLTQKIGTAERH
ncbi:hypothetical protein TNIN_83551 [Trichonephila inaurata madagascariensis]|uniref:Uncharacterized protein n=1 Tax=Trichonephila inaurata madagascariensis TaxID=2747483 RepID=A0A8X7CN83_9ARAC|nr:hypothetical protein TNIN_83551 [Trichonephila inaurata madagascariensis]